jgi:hypothetical protein
MEKPVVGTLLDALDQNNRFKIFAYFSVCFGSLPSAVRFAITSERTKEMTENILAELDLKQHSFEPVFKYWFTEDYKTSNISDDYVSEYVFKSKSDHMLIHFIARDMYLSVDFLYDANIPGAEEWVLQTNHKLRSKFGDEKSPKFKVLMVQEGQFGTEDVNTNDFQSIDINELYNDDFAETDQVISDFMSKQESGIIVLHGEPGTGKTTYIKHLISKFGDKEFIFVQNDFVGDLLKPSFISFLLQHKNATLIIEDAEKVVITRDHSSEDSVVSTILQLTDGLFSDFLNIKIICTFNTDIDRIDKALLRKGRLIAKYHFMPLSSEKANALAEKLGHKDLKGSHTLADIFKQGKGRVDNQSKRAIGFVQHKD